MKAMISLLLFLLILASPALAEIDIVTYPVGDGFSIAPGASVVELCRCESGADTVVVRNTGQYASQFTIEGFGSEYVSISDAAFELMPGETKTVYLFFRAPCDKEIGQKVTFQVDDIFQNTYVFEKEFVTRKCQNLEASLAVDVEQPLQPCTPVTYEVYVQNTGVFTETYNVAFGGRDFEGYFATPYQSLIIPPRKTGVASTNLHLPCGMSGEFIIPFLVEAEQNGLFAELEHALTVSPDYDFDVELSSPAQVCREDWDELYVRIRNDAPFNNTYDLSVRGADFFALERESVSLDAGEEAVVQLFAEPTKRRLGGYAFTLTVTDRTAGWSQSVEQNISLMDCFGASINIDLQQDVEACSGRLEFPVIIRNTGLEHEDITAWANGSYAWISHPSLSLAPGESFMTTLVMDVPYNRSLDEVITVSAAVAGVDVVSTDSLSVSLLDEQGCAQPYVTPARKRVSVFEEEVVFSLENIGRTLTEYDVRFDGPAWLALARDDEYVVLQPGESENLSLLLHQDGSNWTRRYDGTIKIYVDSHEEDRALEYWFPVTVQVHGKSVFLKAYEYFSVRLCHFGSVVLLLIIVVLAVILLARPRVNRRYVQNLFVILFLLWLVGVIVFLSVQGMPPSLYDSVEQDAGDPLTVRVAEDSFYGLNVSQYFVDPDGDLLVFTVSDMDNVSVAVINGTAWFTPDKDWAGTRRFRISAFDGNGGMTESPRMSLEVVDRPEYAIGDLYARYCGYINLLLLLLLVFLIDRVAMAKRKPLPPVAKQQQVVLKKAPRPTEKSAPKRRSMKRRNAKT